MSYSPSVNPINLEQGDTDLLHSLSLRGYRFLSCRHLTPLHFRDHDECRTRMAEFCHAGLVSPLATTMGKSGQEAIYTLTAAGARELARLSGISPAGLASIRKPSYLFLEHELRISDFMCSLEAALKGRQARIVRWKSERQLRPPRGRFVRVSHPHKTPLRTPVIPDGLFSLERDGRVENFLLEADRGTMSISAMRSKMLGYVQLYRKGLHRDHFSIPHFRVLMVTNTPYRRDKLRETLRAIGCCPNMFWFSLWLNISPEEILGKIWLKSRDSVYYSILE